MACRPTSDSWSSSDRDGEIVLRPAVPMKSPIKLMSGLRSLALEVAPPKVCVWASCGSGAGTGAAGEDVELGSTPGSIRVEASNRRVPVVGSAGFVSRIVFNSPRSKATSSASVRTCSSRARMRTSSGAVAAAPAEGGLWFPEIEDFSCGYADIERRTTSDKAENRFMALLLAKKMFIFQPGYRLNYDLARGQEARAERWRAKPLRKAKRLR